MPVVTGTTLLTRGCSLSTSTTPPTTPTTTMVVVPSDFNPFSQREIFKEIFRFELKGRKLVLEAFYKTILVCTPLNIRDTAILVGIKKTNLLNFVLSVLP
jgi:hypothetical protein